MGWHVIEREAHSDFAFGDDDIGGHIATLAQANAFLVPIVL